jgi:hypothetical protein
VTEENVMLANISLLIHVLENPNTIIIIIIIIWRLNMANIIPTVKITKVFIPNR